MGREQIYLYFKHKLFSPQDLQSITLILLKLILLPSLKSKLSTSNYECLNFFTLSSFLEIHRKINLKIINIYVILIYAKHDKNFKIELSYGIQQFHF